MKHYETFTGRVGQLRDLVELGNGNCVVSFSVAETPRVKQQDGTWADGVTVWTDVSIFGDEARNLVRSVKPGTFVTVHGYRSAREYTPKDSTEKRIVQQVVAEQISVAITKFNFIESVGNVNYKNGGAPSQPQGNYQQQGQQQGGYNQQQNFNQNATAQQNNNYNQTQADPFATDSDPFANSGSSDDPFSQEDPFNLG